MQFFCIVEQHFQLIVFLLQLIFRLLALYCFIDSYTITLSNSTALSSLGSLVPNSPRKARARMAFLIRSICSSTPSADSLACCSLARRLSRRRTISHCSFSLGRLISTLPIISVLRFGCAAPLLIALKAAVLLVQNNNGTVRYQDSIPEKLQFHR